MDECEWDVAFSLLSRDTSIAEGLKARLEERYHVFLYTGPRTQQAIAGTDGQASFTKVFREKTRLVGVLYRVGWGETLFTRIEEDAVKDRAREQRLEDFLLVINLEQEPPDLGWLPWGLLWLGYHRYGFETTVGVVEQNLQRTGARPWPDTASNKAARLDDHIAWSQERWQFLQSPEGRQLLNQEKEKVFSGLEDMAGRFSDEAGMLDIAIKKSSLGGGILYILGHGHTLSVNWEVAFDDEGHNVSRFYVMRWQGYKAPNILSAKEPQELGNDTYTIDLPRSRMVRWRRSRDDRVFATKNLIEELMKQFLDLAEQDLD